MFLPIAGAALGGLQGYQQSKGDLGAALLGAGLGAAGGAGLGAAGGLATRFAGQFLPAGLTGSALSAVNTARGIPLLGKLIPGNLSLAQQAALGSKITGAANLIPAAAGAATIGLGSMAIPALAGGIAAGTPAAARKVVPAATGAYGVGQQLTGTGMPGLPDVPGYTVGGNLSQYGPPAAIAYNDPAGNIRQQLEFENRQFNQTLGNALKILPYQEAYSERAKEAGLRRDAAAAQLRTALETDAAMRRQGQLGAQRMSEGLLNNVGQAMATQYRYF